MPAIFYARHAESTWNASGRWQGQADPPLSKRGRQQAAALAERLAAVLGSRGVDRLATSPLARARQTAAILGERLGATPRPEPGLRELDAGRWSGLTRAEVERRDARAMARFLAGDPELRAGRDGETRRELRARVVAALRGLAAAEPEGTIVVVGHQGALLSILPGLRLGNAEFLELPASVLEEPVARAGGEER